MQTDYVKPSDRLRKKYGHDGYPRLESDMGWGIGLLAIFVLFMFALVWNFVGDMQQKCLELNAGDITKCV